MALSISEIAATIAHRRSKELADAVTANNALFYKLEKAGNIRKADFGGSTVTETISYSGLNTVDDGILHDAGFFKGFATFNPTLGAEVVTASEWEAAELGGIMSFSNRQKWQSASKEAVIDLIEAKLVNLKQELQNLFSTSTFSDGTAFGGNEFDGLKAIISTTPNVGTTGGIDRAAHAWWRNKALDNSAGTVTTLAAMDDMMLQVTRGADRPDLIIAGKDAYTKYQQEVEPIRRITNKEMGDAGFISLEFQGVPVVYDANCDANLMYFVNTKSLKFRHPKGWWFKTEDAQKVPGSTYEFVPCYVTGNFTCNNLALNGVLTL